MNANGLARNYGCLSPEERWRLILAAIARGDDVEQSRLVNASPRIDLTTHDYVPFGHAFDELSLLVFLELLEVSADYLAVVRPAVAGLDGQAGAAEPLSANESEQEPESNEWDDEEDEPDMDLSDGSEGIDEPTIPEEWREWSALQLALGFILQTKANGWKLFCERMTIPPFALWEGLPGYHRLRRALALAELNAFEPAQYLQWRNNVRQPGEPELTELTLTVERVADLTATLYRDFVISCGGPA